MARNDPSEALLLRMSVDLARLEKQWGAAYRVQEKRLSDMEKRATQSDKRLSRIMGQAGQNMTAALKTGLAGLAPVVASAFSAQQVLKYADSYTSLQNQLRATGRDGERLVATENALYAAANRNGVAVSATAQLYQRASLARDRLGASEDQLQALVSGTTAALRVQGTSANEAAGPLLQLGQVLNGNKVQAEEYNSLIDGLPVLLQAVANGSDRFGGSIARLTELVKDGKVTSAEFFAAALKGLPALEAQAESMQLTVGGAFQVLDNQLGRYIGQADAGLSASQRLAQGIERVANNLDDVTLIVGAVATLMGGRFVLSMTAGSGAMIANGVAAVRLAGFQAAMTASLTGTTTATVVATGAMARFNAMLAANPIGATVIAVAALSAGIVFLGQRLEITGNVSQEVSRANTALSKSTEAYSEAARAAAIATGQAAAAAREDAAAKRAQAIATRDSAAAKLAEARATIAQIQATAQGMLDAERFNIRGDRPGSVRTISRADQQRLADAQAEQRARQAAITSANAAIAEADQALARRAPVITPDDDKKTRTRGPSGPTPEELARQRQLLSLQAEVEQLRAQGRDVEAETKQDQIDTLNLTKQYEDAGFEGARARAEQHVAALAAAREAERVQERAKVLAEGEARAIALTRDFVMDILDAQESLALTEAEALAVRRQILEVRQRERREALETIAADADATEAERRAARDALRDLPRLEGDENRGLQGSSSGAKEAQDVVADIRAPDDRLEQIREMYAEIERLRQEDRISEEEAVRAKSEVDLRYREARLENTRTMLDTLATLQNSSNKKIAAIGKAAAIAQATIDGVLAVQKALASAPPPFNFIQAAIVGAATAANVASIAGMADGGLVRGPGGPREDKVLRRLSAGEFVVNARATAQNRGLLEQINSGRLPGMADGGLVARAAAAVESTAAAGRLGDQSFSYSPTIDARGADGAAIRRLEQLMEEERQSFAERVNIVRERRSRYRLGRPR